MEYFDSGMDGCVVESSNHWRSKEKYNCVESVMIMMNTYTPV